MSDMQDISAEVLVWLLCVLGGVVVLRFCGIFPWCGVDVDGLGMVMFPPSFCELSSRRFALLKYR